MKCFNRLVCLFALPLLLAACGESARDREITDIGIAPPEERVAPPQVSNHERLGLHVSSSAHTMMAHPEESEESPYEWTVPPTWQEAPEQSMRVVTFIPEGSQGSECYISLLGGAAGGVEANINRWRHQLGLPPFSDEEIAALPRIILLGTEAVLVELEGELSGSEGATLPTRIYGLVCPLELSTLFVKMTGPVEELEGEKENFQNFVSSIAFREGGRS